MDVKEVVGNIGCMNNLFYPKLLDVAIFMYTTYYEVE